MSSKLQRTSIRVREIRREDVRDIIEIMRKSRLDFPWGLYYNVEKLDEEIVWERIRGPKDYPTLVAEYDGKVIALATNRRHWDEKDNYYIGWLIAHPKYRGRGAGTALIKESLRRAVEKEFNVISLHTWANNRAMRLYARTGFCWIPSSHVYMVNFSPQLMKYEEIKEIFKDPENLIDCLLSPPEKISVKGHVAWRYKWRIDDREIEAIFDNATRKLLAIKIDKKLIKLTPPENKQYLKGEKVSIGIEVSEESIALVENKQYLLTRGTHLLNIEAKDTVSLKIDNYEFGFKLKVVEPLEIRMSRIDGDRIFLIIINNKDDPIEDELLVIPIDGVVKVLPNKLRVSIPPKTSRIFKLRVIGEGAIKVVLGSKEETFYILKKDYIRLLEDGLESSFWRVGGDEIVSRKISGIEIWYDLLINGEEFSLEFNKERRVFLGKFEELLLEVKPELFDREVILDITVRALRDVEGWFSIRFWVDLPSSRNFFLVPRDSERVVKGLVAYSKFPKAFAIIKKKLDIPVIGFDFKDRRLLIEYDEDGLYTMERSPLNPRIDFPLKLAKGEVLHRRIHLEITEVSEKLYGRKVIREVETTIEGDHLIIRNNWFNSLQLRIILDNKELSRELGPLEELTMPIDRKGLGCIDVLTDINNGLIEKRRLQYVIPEELEWEDKTAIYGHLTLSLSDLGGSVKDLKMNNDELLLWGEEKLRTPLRIPVTHGGIVLNIVEDGESLDLHLKKWSYIGNGAFEIRVKDLEIKRKYLGLDKNALMEEIVIRNNGVLDRKLTIHHCVFFNENFSAVGCENLEIRGGKILAINHDTRVWGLIRDKKVEVSLIVDGENKTVNAIQLTNFTPVIESRWSWHLLPGEEKKAVILLRISPT
ncbi:MAG: GNAT family N-acetyltransferase [Candidatus Njordarchaeales archaeon]